MSQLREFRREKDFLLGKISNLQDQVKEIDVKISENIAPITADLDNIRAMQGKETGTVSLERDGFTFKSNIAKTVVWDQDKLRNAVQKIDNFGDNPDDYVVTSYKVDERKFKKFSKTVQGFFSDARTVKHGTPTLKIEEVTS